MNDSQAELIENVPLRPVAEVTGSLSEMTQAIQMTTTPGLVAKPSNIPPAPQISQKLLSIPLGYQFAYSQLVSPTPYGNTISAYRIYRNTASNNFSGALLIRTIVHDPTHQGSVTVQDTVLGTKTYYYFITSVDTFGQESTNNSFQSGPVTSGNANPNALNAVGVTSGPSTSSTTYVVIPEMVITATFSGGKVLLILSMQATTSGPTPAACNFAFFRDGVQFTTDFSFINAGVVGGGWMYSLSFIDSPSAGSHTYDARWKVGIGTATITTIGTQRTFQAVELG